MSWREILDTSPSASFSSTASFHEAMLLKPSFRSFPCFFWQVVLRFFSVSACFVYVISVSSVFPSFFVPIFLSYKYSIMDESTWWQTPRGHTATHCPCPTCYHFLPVRLLCAVGVQGRAVLVGERRQGQVPLPRASRAASVLAVRLRRRRLSATSVLAVTCLCQTVVGLTHTGWRCSCF